MRIWFDTEFIEDGHTIDLISIGMVREDGEVLYLQNDDADMSKSSQWVKDNVIDKLDASWVSRSSIKDAVRSFAGNDPEFWAYYADYDWVVLCQLYGTMMDLPKGWPMYCRDVQQLCDMLGGPELPKHGNDEHNALADARWTKTAWEYLQTSAKLKAPE